MAGVTYWVRQALMELGLDASRKEIVEYVLQKDPTAPESQIPLAIRKLKRGGLSGGIVWTKKRPPETGTSQDLLDCPEQ